MTEPKVQVKEMMRHLQTEGRLSETSLREASAGAWDRVTPAMVALLAIQLAIVDELGGLPEDGSVGRLLSHAVAQAEGLEEFEVADLEAWLLADVVRASRLDGPDRMTWDVAFRLLAGVASARRLSSAGLDDLLERAEGECRRLLDDDRLLEPRVRAGEYGPWDFSEAWSREVDRLDLGPLLVPRVPGVDILPYRVDDQILGVIAKLVGMRCVLQAFRVVSSGKTWSSSRRSLISSAAAKGGEARETNRALGPEVTAYLPRPEGGELQGFRFVGCDGPGWLLRGIISGAGVMSDVIDGRIHFIFTNTVVNLRGAESVNGGALVLHWPTEAA